MADTQPAGTVTKPAGEGRQWGDIVEKGKRADVPAGLWMRCPECETMLYKKIVEQSLRVCPDCGAHYRLGGDERAAQLCDPGSFEPLWEDVGPVDVLGFADRIPYAERLAKAQQATGRKEAVICGRGFIKGRRLALACMDFRFIMASMGCVVGEKMTRTIELATEESLPLVIVSAAGGARMHEGTLSLMQMAKTSAALARHDDARGLFISVITDPTTGGVTASFAMLGDVILAEPKALIGFAGARVIANTIRQELPEGFQRSERLLETGFIDKIVHRKDLRSEISRIIDYAGK